MCVCRELRTLERNKDFKGLCLNADKTKIVMERNSKFWTIEMGEDRSELRALMKTGMRTVN